MVDIDHLKKYPEAASADDVRELIRLLELARGAVVKAIPSYADEGPGPTADGEIGDIKTIPR